MNYSQLRHIIREIIKKYIKEGSSTGTGDSFSAGGSEAYATPFAFSKRKKPKKIKY
jgi:hypothetical protein